MGKKTSLNNFGCQNVSTCTESGAAHTSQSIQTALVQHTTATTEPNRELAQSIDNKTVVENNATTGVHSASLFSSAVAGLPSLLKVSVDIGKHA